MDDKNPLKMKVSELKTELGRRGLSQTGLKFDLAQRLQTAMDVDEFGALPSLTTPSQSSSSPLLSVSAKDPTDHSDSPPNSPQTISCEAAQGGPSDEQARDLEMAAGTKGSEAVPPIEQSCLGDASIVSDARPSEESATPGTEDIFTVEEKPGSGENDRDQNKANHDGSDDNIHAGIAVDEKKPADDGGGNVEHEGAGIVGSSEKTNGLDGCVARATANADTSLLLSFGSPESEKNNDTDGYAGSGENALLLLLSDPTNPASVPPSPPPKGAEEVEQEDKDQPEVGGEEPGGNTTETDGAKPDFSYPKETGVKGTTTNCDANQTNQTNQETETGPSGFAPDSLLLSSLTERMKDREARFRQEKNTDDNKGGNESQVRGETGDDGPRPSNAGGHDDLGGTIGRRCGSGGSEGGKISLPSAGSVGPEVHGAQAVEEDRRAKLIKRKERFMAPPPASSGNDLLAKSGSSYLAKLMTPMADRPSRKVSSGVLGEETSGPASPKRQAAREVAAKMARRSERFGVMKGAGSSASRGAASTEVPDPRGSFFADSEETPLGNTQQSTPPPGGYSFEPLPQRPKRARAATTPSCNNDGTPPKRRGVDRSSAGALEKTTSPDGLEARDNSGEGAKTTERPRVRFQVASSNGVDESPLGREETGEPSLPSSSGKRMSLGSSFVLLGVKKTAPKPPPTTTAAGKGKGKETPRIAGRGGDEVGGASNHPAEYRDKGGQANNQSQPRKGLTVAGIAAGQASFRDLGREGQAQAEKKFAEQAAKMAERRKRFAGDPRAPSFR